MVTIAHGSYLARCYLSDDTTVVTNATFYDENNRLKLPQFFLCFSKVFAYNQLSVADTAWLYNRSNIRSPHSPKYDWRIKVNDLILGVWFNDNRRRPTSFFKPAFHLPTKTCWKTTSHNFTAGQAGQLDTLNLVINAAVYDDLILSYDSPLAYLAIIPYFPRSSEVIPGSRSKTKISPGRLSSIGFSWKKVDSTHRSKRDVRKCDRSGQSGGGCESSFYRRALKRNCKIEVPKVTAVHTYYSCGLMANVDTEKCLFQPCKEDIFQFTKSEAYLKFDKRLSGLRITKSQLSAIRTNVKTATRLHSKFNPTVRQSFQDITRELASLTRDISVALGRPRGRKCDIIVSQNTHLVSTVLQVLPSAIAEREKIRILRSTFIRLSEKTFRKLADMVLSWPSQFELLDHSPIPSILPTEIKNTQPNSNKQFKAQLSKVGDVVSSFSRLFAELYEQTLSMSTVFQHLSFTQFIQQYSSIHTLVDYNKLSRVTILSIQSLTKRLFEGKNPTVGCFAHQDDKLRVIHRLTQYPSKNVLNAITSALNMAYPNTIWMQHLWLLNKGFKSPGVSLFEVIYDTCPKPQKIPLTIELYCTSYVNLVSKLERYNGAEPTFRLQLAGSKFELNHQVASYVVDQLLQEYDTSVLLSIEHNQLIRAEHLSCSRLVGHPLYLEPNATFHTAAKSIHAYLLRVHGKWQDEKVVSIPGHTKVILIMIAQYLISLEKFKVESARFEAYYSRYVVPSFGSPARQVDTLRQTFNQFHRYTVEHQSHKKFLIARLHGLANLIDKVWSGDSEEEISDFLTKKGKILIGEIKYEIAEVNQVLSEAEQEYWHHREVINNIVTNINNRSLEGAVMQAVLTARFHPNIRMQQEILRNLSRCNDAMWKMTKNHLRPALLMMVKWLRNTTLLVTRAKRYTESLQISKSFLRKNMMHVLLYYDSLTVLTETNEPLYPAKAMMAKFGAALRIYLKMGTFRIFDLVTSGFANMVKWMIK